ncbi:MarR family winged helix-turn-helix transcriptional regulator [Paenibacillus sp. YYML68]|uniref:MarR family winged helix-turn-helix transcriptional regulator n=1 Tax=Paenibacillus sp. YYML68 TaxID=2909250 RepID=UPI002490A92C|nr:MarR family transcriptional regulator [Paenibacillus sp. YYML68]
MKQIVARYEAASFTVNRRINAMIRECMQEELTLDQYSILRYIGDRSQCTSSELAEAFCVGKSSITAIITRLAAKRLIVRLPDEKDRRVTYLALTEEGRRLSDVVESSIQQLLTRLMEHFQPEEAEAFIGTYEKLAKVLVMVDEKGDTEE